MVEWVQLNPVPAASLILGLFWLLGKVAGLVWPHFWKATSNEGVVTQDQCNDCDARHAAEMSQGNDLFRLILEGQAIHTQALIALCDNDEECRELKQALREHLAKLASRQIGR